MKLEDESSVSLGKSTMNGVKQRWVESCICISIFCFSYIFMYVFYFYYYYILLDLLGILLGQAMLFTEPVIVNNNHL